MFLDISRPGCVVAGDGPLGKPVECHNAPTHAGLVLFAHPRPRVWLVFACREHSRALIAARPMLERDRAELARREAARRRAFEEGTPNRRLQPLEVGSAALHLVARARAWASAHSGRESGADYDPTGVAPNRVRDTTSISPPRRRRR